MKFFYLSSKPNSEGYFEIHDRECPHIPDAVDRDYLGPFNNGQEALNRVVLKNPQAVTCTHCCKGGSQAVIFSEKNSKSS